MSELLLRWLLVNERNIIWICNYSKVCLCSSEIIPAQKDIEPSSNLSFCDSIKDRIHPQSKSSNIPRRAKPNSRMTSPNKKTQKNREVGEEGGQP